MEPKCGNEAALSSHEQAATHTEWSWIIWVAYAGSRIAEVPDVSSRSQGRIQGCDDEAAASDQDVTRRPLQIPLGVRTNARARGARHRGFASSISRRGARRHNVARHRRRLGAAHGTGGLPCCGPYLVRVEEGERRGERSFGGVFPLGEQRVLRPSCRHVAVQRGTGICNALSQRDLQWTATGDGLCRPSPRPSSATGATTQRGRERPPSQTRQVPCRLAPEGRSRPRCASIPSTWHAARDGRCQPPALTPPSFTPRARNARSSGRFCALDASWINRGDNRARRGMRHDDPPRSRTHASPVAPHGQHVRRQTADRPSDLCVGSGDLSHKPRPSCTRHSRHAVFLAKVEAARVGGSAREDS